MGTRNWGREERFRAMNEGRDWDELTASASDEVSHKVLKHDAENLMLK